MTHGRQTPNGLGGENLVRYRVDAPDVWEPPRTHKRLRQGVYLGVYQPRFELLNELDIITVQEWEAKL